MPFNETIGDFECLVLFGCNWRFTTIELIVMPPFQPTDHFWAKQKG
jgi:hypothetical protein